MRPPPAHKKHALGRSEANRRSVASHANHHALCHVAVAEKLAPAAIA